YAIFHGGTASATVAFNVHTEEPEFGHCGNQFGGQVGIVDPFGNVGAHASVNEIRNGIANFKFLLDKHSGNIEEICFRQGCAPSCSCSWQYVTIFTLANLQNLGNNPRSSLPKMAVINVVPAFKLNIHFLHAYYYVHEH